MPRILILALCAGLLSACASVPYEFGNDLERPETLRLRPGELQIERGERNALVDGLGNLFSLPVKLLLLSTRVENHAISEETETQLHAYLAENDLANVKVRLNQYDPGGEWDRLFENRDVSPLWRYTVGAMTVAAYTLLPQRVFGGDNFNPFTNTIHLYSDIPAIALHEAGHAKDFAKVRYKGSYAALRMLPLVPLYQEAMATGDAIGYERRSGDTEGEKQAYKVLYPAYGTYLGGEIVRWVPLGSAGLAYAIQYGAVIPLHIIGRTKAWLVGEPKDARAEATLEAP